MDIVEILTKARDLITPEGAWTQEEYARTASGVPVDPLADEATCFCAVGACTRVAGKYSHEAVQALMKVSRSVLGFADYNDANERTQQEIIDWFNAAIATEQSKKERN